MKYTVNFRINSEDAPLTQQDFIANTPDDAVDNCYAQHPGMTLYLDSVVDENGNICPLRIAPAKG